MSVSAVNKQIKPWTPPTYKVTWMDGGKERVVYLVGCVHLKHWDESEGTKESDLQLIHQRLQPILDNAGALFVEQNSSGEELPPPFTRPDTGEDVKFSWSGLDWTIIESVEGKIPILEIDQRTKEFEEHVAIPGWKLLLSENGRDIVELVDRVAEGNIYYLERQKRMLLSYASGDGKENKYSQLMKDIATTTIERDLTMFNYANQHLPADYKPVVIAVGALHLVGETGLCASYKNFGAKVEEFEYEDWVSLHPHLSGYSSEIDYLMNCPILSASSAEDDLEAQKLAEVDAMLSEKV